MNSTLIFNSIILVLFVNFLFDQYLSYLNRRNWKAKLPPELTDVYDDKKYAQARKYAQAKVMPSLFSDWMNFLLILVLLFFNGYAAIDIFTASLTENSILRSLLFFGMILFLGDFLNLPFSLYSIFVIEEKFGFNKTTIKTFIADKIKGLVLLVLLGGGLFYLFAWFYEVSGPHFWLWAWAMVTVVMLSATMFYASVILPLFNKLTPLEEGELRSAIEAYCNKVDFKLDNLFVMDGSRRSTKANAFFSGLGPRKKIVLYDTLINDLSIEEVVAVLAHEVGHYKHKHTRTSILLSILQTGIMLYILSLFVNRVEFSQALGSEHSLHMSLLVFSILYSPVSLVVGLLLNILSRKNEFEADAYAKETFKANALVGALKKLSINSLSNPTPHPWYVFVHFSHPTLLKRMMKLQ